MNFKFLLPLIIVSAGAHADLVPDRKAATACDNRFHSVNRRQGLNLRAGPIHRAASSRVGPFQYYFNATQGDTTYRVQCRAMRSGRVLNFALDQGRWVFDDAASEGIAAS